MFHIPSRCTAQDRFQEYEEGHIWSCLQRVGMEQAMRDMETTSTAIDTDTDTSTVTSTAASASGDEERESTTAEAAHQGSSQCSGDANGSDANGASASAADGILSQHVSESGGNLSLGQVRAY